MYGLNKINNNEIDIYSKINEPDVHFLCKGYDVLKEKFFIYYEDLFYIRGIKKIFYFAISSGWKCKGKRADFSGSFCNLKRLPLIFPENDDNIIKKGNGIFGMWILSP